MLKPKCGGEPFSSTITGEAKFVAITQDIEAETTELYHESAASG
jgi:hypothetical protein